MGISWCRYCKLGVGQYSILDISKKSQYRTSLLLYVVDSNMSLFLMHVQFRLLHPRVDFYQQLSHPTATTKSSRGAASATRTPLYAVTPVMETCTACAASGTDSHLPPRIKASILWPRSFPRSSFAEPGAWNMKTMIWNAYHDPDRRWAGHCHAVRQHMYKVFRLMNYQSSPFSPQGRSR